MQEMNRDAFEQHAAHKAQYSIGHERKYMEERRAALHVEQARAKPLDVAHKRRELWLAIGGIAVLLLMILGLCACVWGITIGSITIF